VFLQVIDLVPLYDNAAIDVSSVLLMSLSSTLEVIVVSIPHSTPRTVG
jgi:hypothetical protein